VLFFKKNVEAVMTENVNEIPVVRWRHVLAPRDGIMQLGFVEPETEKIIRLNISVEQAQELIGSVIAYVDPMPADLQVCLGRQGLSLKSD
jgi:hypothetical protein